MQLYNPTRGYTWEKKGSSRVQLRDSKDGFTFLPVVSAAGMVGAQLIFDGKTSAALPSVAPGSMLHYEQTSNHWSDEGTTVKLFNSIVFPHIAKRRAELQDPSAPAIVLADAYPAHWTSRVQQLVAQNAGVAYVAIPDCLTHLFQPCDLGIIAAIKQSVLRRKDEFLEEELRAAIRENRSISLATSRPVLRNRMATFIKDVVEDPSICAEHCCLSGFRRAGITRVLYNDGTAVPDVDQFVEPLVCQECGEAAQKSYDIPCSCFSPDCVPVLCDGCFHNHENLCQNDC